ncbi:uncharacterized protein LOC143240958 isoform X3 [Tachypleus tridentatus]|uniref:uncharacterized protein LOC143240958 isoform X3 n=1 Tax=Tachypleus tridentatus TaxID=6853 RepID=UPI003FD50981
MSLWAVIFLELWKRYSEKITHYWDMTSFDTLECGTGACLFELSLQLAIIVVWKQFVNAVAEMGIFVAVWICHNFCGCISSGTIICFTEQHHRNQARC